MKKQETPVDLIRQREIEIKVLGPVIRAFAAEIGREKAFDIVRRTMQELSRQQGQEKAAAFGGGLESLKANCIAAWNKNGELASETLCDTPDELRFDVTRCDFATLYQDLGFGDLGTLLSCDRDVAFLEGFDPSLELVREKILMTGDELCDFCYKKKTK